MAYSKLTAPIKIQADEVNEANPLQRNYYGALITIGEMSEIYGRVCLDLEQCMIELYDGKTDPCPIATIPLIDLR